MIAKIVDIVTKKLKILEHSTNIDNVELTDKKCIYKFFSCDQGIRTKISDKVKNFKTNSIIANSKIEKNAQIFIKLQYSECSILGPIFFNFINDLPETANCIKLFLADNMKQITEKQYTETSASNCTVIVSLNGNELRLN